MENNLLKTKVLNEFGCKLFKSKNVYESAC